MRDTDFAGRSAALQRAMSAALLEHQISELQAQVQDLNVARAGSARQPQGSFQLNPGARIWGDDSYHPVKRSPRQETEQFGTIGGGRTSAPRSPAPPIGLPRTEARISSEPQQRMRQQVDQKSRPARIDAGMGRIDDTPQDSDSANGGRNTRSESSDDEDDEAEWDTWKIVVLDVSALMWAPQSVRRLLARGWEAVLPLEAVRTLDILKKGSTPAAVAARAATRYVEHAMRQYNTMPSNALALSSLPGSNFTRGRGLRIQREGEVAPISSLTDLPIPVDDIPRWAVNVLECVAHVAGIAQAYAKRANGPDVAADFTSTQGIFVVANPPLRLEVDSAAPSVPAGREGKDGYNERGEGYLISQEAERFEIGLEVLRDEELEDMGPEQEHPSRRGRGRGERGGRGRGRGGAGRGGRGGRPDKIHGAGRNAPSGHEHSDADQEVKVLLRRPVTTTDEERSPHAGHSSLDETSPRFSDHPSLPASPRAPTTRRPVRRASNEFVPLRKEDVAKSRQPQARVGGRNEAPRDVKSGHPGGNDSGGRTKGPTRRGGPSGGSRGGSGGARPTSMDDRNADPPRDGGFVLLRRPEAPLDASNNRNGQNVPRAQPQILRRPVESEPRSSHANHLQPNMTRNPTHALPARPADGLGRSARPRGSEPDNLRASHGQNDGHAPPRGVVLLQRPKPA